MSRAENDDNDLQFPYFYGTQFAFGDRAYPDRSEYLACPEDHFDLLLDYIRDPSQFDEFGKEPMTAAEIADHPVLSQMRDIRPVTPEDEATYHKYELRRYGNAQREESVVKQYGDSPEKLLDYLRNHVDLCPACLTKYIQKLIDSTDDVPDIGFINNVRSKDSILLGLFGPRRPGKYR